MKVLFVDIDGVFNREGVPLEGVFTFDETLLPLLCQIILRSGAKIVLSSTWRKSPLSRWKVEEAFQNHALEFISWTIVYDKDDRTKEIREWLDRHPQVTRYAILDNEPVALDNLFQTDPREGLTEALAQRITHHLTACG